MGQHPREAWARVFAELHKPIAFDWTAKFGLSKEPPAQPSAKPDPVPEAPKAAAVAQALAPEIQKPAAEHEQKPKQKLVCHTCGTSVAYNVAKFCWFNKPKFGGNIYCMDCQRTVSAA